jgi:hypothetical protein
MGMLECLRAPSTARGVPAAGDAGLSPSWRGVSFSNSRRNCELFIVLAVYSRVAPTASVEKFRQAPDAPDSRAASQNAGSCLSTSIDVTQEHASFHTRPSFWPEGCESSVGMGPAGNLLAEPGYLHSLAIYIERAGLPLR